MIALALLGCTGPELPVGLELGSATVIEPLPEGQTHPALVATEAGWAVAWDVGGAGGGRVEAVRLRPDAVPDEPVDVLGPAVGGFGTPEVARDPFTGRIVVAFRAGSNVLVGEHQVSGSVRVAGTGNLGFWTAPDLAMSSVGAVLGWWEGSPAPDDPATYWLRAGNEPAVEVGRSPGAGSPLALAADEAGLWVAYSVREAGEEGFLEVVRLSTAGVEQGRRRVAQGLGAPTRPALAPDGSGGVIVGWRVQSETQEGRGVWIRHLSSALAPQGPAQQLGGEAVAANRIELAAGGDLAAAVWEAREGLLVQLLERSTAAPLGDPRRIEPPAGGTAERPRVAFALDAARLAVAYELRVPEEPPRIALAPGHPEAAP